MELLAPAGNLDKLKTAVLYGANAVYLAGQKFSLRGASDNFSDTELLEGVLFARKNNCKTYVTLNAFLHDQELKELPEYVSFLEKCGVDARWDTHTHTPEAPPHNNPVGQLLEQYISH